MMRFRFAAAIATAAELLLLTAAAAWAGGPPVVNQNDHFVNEIDTSLDVHPCTGQLGELTLTESGHIHFSFFANGTVHISGTLRGSFSFDTLPADGTPDATGTFTTWFGGNGMLLEEGGATGRAETGFTLNGRGTNADGSPFRFHQNGNTVFDSAGVPKLDFAKSRCS
jgi:hypothetical protein